MRFIILLLFSTAVYADSFNFAYMQKACAPHDAPSRMIVFLEKDLDCKKIKGVFPNISINWWDAFPKLPTDTVSFIFNTDQKGAAVSFCPFQNKCKIPEQLGIHFEFLNESKGKGNFILKRKNGKFIKSKFKIKSCPAPKELCG